METLNPAKISLSPSIVKKHKFRVGKKILLVLLAILVLSVVFVLVRSGPPQVFDFVFSQKIKVLDSNGRINVLLLGIAGDGHDGPNLTDTIILASYDNKSRGVSLVSIPRDLWLDQRQSKINALYQIALNQNLPDQTYPLKFVQQEIGNLLGVDIPYAVRVDFNGFVKAVDLVGGVDVNVITAFEDDEYPKDGHENDLCGMQEQDKNLTADQAKNLGVDSGMHRVLIDIFGKIATVSAQVNGALEYTPGQILQYFPCRFDNLVFKKGLTHMDGQTALKYARSRHGTGAEGSDFARSKRQQQILQSFRSKVLSLNTLSDPQKVIELVQTFGKSIDSDISSNQYLDFIKIAKNIKSINSYVIDDQGKNPLLINPPLNQYGGAWVLVPASNDFSRIKNYLQQIFSSDMEATASGQKN